jgi:hypothetical protein
VFPAVSSHAVFLLSLTRTPLLRAFSQLQLDPACGEAVALWCVCAANVFPYSLRSVKDSTMKTRSIACRNSFPLS